MHNPDSAMRSLSSSRKIYFLMPKHLWWYQQSQVSHATLSDLTALWHWPQGHLMFGPGFCCISPAIIKRRLINIRDFCLWIFFCKSPSMGCDPYQIQSRWVLAQYSVFIHSTCHHPSIWGWLQITLRNHSPNCNQNHIYARIFDAAGRVILVDFRLVLSIISGVSVSVLSIIGGLSKYLCFFPNKCPFSF